jgi:ribosomal protein S12 methylthiotransferase accessory factor
MNQTISTDLQTMLWSLVGRQGIIQRIVEVPLQPDEPRIFIAFATFLNPILMRRRQMAPQRYMAVSSAAGYSREDCLWAVIGEACERYAGALYDPDDLIFEDRSRLSGRVIDLTDFIFFSKDQYQQDGFPFRPYDPGTARHWIRGCSLNTGETVAIPAQLVWLGFDYRLETEMLDNVVSTGLAAGSSLMQAVFSGLCEVIERDAFMSTWLLKYPAPRVDPACISCQLDPVLTAATDGIEGMDLNIRYLTNDVDVPVFVALVKPSDQNIFAMGASCHPDPAQAIKKAVLEAYHTWNWTLDLRRKEKPLPDVDSIVDFEDHVRFYLDEQNFHHAEFLYAPTEKRIDLRSPDSTDIVGQTRYILEKLKTAGYEAFYVDLTTPDLAELGLNVVKVLVPGLQPLDASHRYRHQDDRRLRKIAGFLQLRFTGDIHDAPHPFP